MASSIEKLKKELTKANDALYARYEALIQNAKAQQNDALATVDENYKKQERAAAAQAATARANARRAFAEQGLRDSGEEAQNSALHTIGLQNALSDIGENRESALRDINTKTNDTIAKLEAEREKEYNENAMKIAELSAVTKAASSGGSSKEEEENTSSEEDNTQTNNHVYQPLQGVFKYIPAAQRYYVPKASNVKAEDMISPTTTPSTFINKVVDQYTTSGWEGKRTDTAKVTSAIRSFLQNDNIDRSYRAEVKILAMALGYI